MVRTSKGRDRDLDLRNTYTILPIVPHKARCVATFDVEFFRERLSQQPVLQIDRVVVFEFHLFRQPGSRYHPGRSVMVYAE